MTEQTNSNHISRRNFLKGAGAALTLATLGPVVAAIAPASTPTPENSPNAPSEIFTHTISGVELQFKKMWDRTPEPFIDQQGKYFDLTTSQFVTPDNKLPGMLLLSTLPAFDEWRDSQVTADLVQQNKKMGEIVKKTQENLDLVMSRMANGNRNLNNISQNVQETSQQEGTNNTVNFTPTELLVMRQINNALAENLIYNELGPVEFAQLSLGDRLEKGLTNCFEYTLAASTAYARRYLDNISGIPTNIGFYRFKRYDKEKKQEVKGAHVFNIINHNNTCVITDMTMFADTQLTFQDYIKKLQHNGVTITSPIETTSIIANESYDPFPYHDIEWLTADTPLSLRAAYDPSFAENN